MNRKLLTIILVLFSIYARGQEKMELKGEMSYYSGETFLLLAGDDGGVFVVDSSKVNADGILRFSWEGEPGFYRISNKNEHLDFRIKKTSFSFSLSGSIKQGDLQFKGNDENYEYQYYLSELNLLNNSLQDLREVLLQKNESDSLYNEEHNEFKQLKKDKRNLMKDLWGSHIDSWAARFVLAQQEIIPNVKLKPKKADEFYIKHFFDYFAFSDSLLSGTPVYYEKIGKYLKAQKINELIKAENYRAVKQVIGNLFWLTELDPSSQEYLVNYLINRYPEEQYEQVYHLVKDAYQLLNTCEYVLNTNTIRKRIQSSKQIKKFWQAPDVSLFHCTNGRVKTLSDVNSDLTLILVWSASCEHSIEMLSNIYDLYFLYKDLGFEVVAISLDTNLNFWERTISFHNYPWINACDTNGLSGDVASQLSIYVTPTMFLIDSSLKVIATPQTIFQLEKTLGEVYR